MKRSIVLGVLALCVLTCSVVFAHPMSVDPEFGVAILANAGLALNSEEFKKLEEAVVKKAGEVVEQVQKLLKDEVDKFNALTTKGNEKLTEVSADAKKATEAVATFKAELLDLQQKLARKPGAEGGGDKTTGQIFVQSEEFKHAAEKGLSNVPRVNVGGLHKKTAILNAQGQNQPLVPDMRVPGIITPATRRLTIRDLLPQLRTDSNLVQFASENVFTNNAGVQFSSPNDRENVPKNESGITFTLSNAPVVTVAHWIPASRQILADAPGLASYIDTRLTYGLKLYEESQLLTGDGTGGNINGINTQAASYNRGVSNDTMLDCLLKAMLQVALSEYSATGIILNPIDWTQIQLLKDTMGRYLFANPQSVSDPMLWGLPVVATNSQTAGQFTAGAFALAAAIWDREDAEVRVLEQHDDFAVKNMVAILVEERLTLTVYRTSALVKGSLPAIGT